LNAFSVSECFLCAFQERHIPVAKIKEKDEEITVINIGSQKPGLAAQA
jgi:hypothetical protein